MLSCGKHSHMYKKLFGVGIIITVMAYLLDINFGMYVASTY